MKRVMLLMLASLAAGNTFAATANPQAAKTIVDTICIACHTTTGNSIIPLNPNLAGQHEQYIYRQLKAFKTNVRQNPTMFGMTATLSDQDMRNLAAYFSRQKLTPLSAHDKTLVPLGEKIYRVGNPANHVPACMGCHGPNGKGIPDEYPSLSSQHKEYITAQLLSFKEGTVRKHVMMQDIASRMSDADIKAVAEYIAGLR